MSWSIEPPTTLGQALTTAKSILGSSLVLRRRGVVETEAEQIVQGVLQISSRMDLFSDPSRKIELNQGEKVLEIALRRSGGEVLQHLLGHQQFLDHLFSVDASTLVPRPETEVLAAAVIEYLGELKKHGARKITALEVGVGTGAIAISMLHASPELKMLVSEISPEARKLCKKNAQKILGSLERLQVLPVQNASDVFEPFVSVLSPVDLVDLIVSNPPYLIQEDEIDPEVRAHEPAAALFAPIEDALYFYRRIAEQAGSLLRPEGRIYLEIPHQRRDAIELLFKTQEWKVEVLTDLQKVPRVLIANR